MQAFGHQLDSNLMDDANFQGPYRPEIGRADRLSANIPGSFQSDWGMNGDHMGTGLGGANQ